MDTPTAPARNPDLVACIEQFITPERIAAGREMVGTPPCGPPTRVGDMTRNDLRWAIRLKDIETCFERGDYSLHTGEDREKFCGYPMAELTDEELIGCYAIMCATLESAKKARREYVESMRELYQAEQRHVDQMGFLSRIIYELTRDRK
jgi:hypothetical protein